MCRLQVDVKGSCAGLEVAPLCVHNSYKQDTHTQTDIDFRVRGDNIKLSPKLKTQFNNSENLKI